MGVGQRNRGIDLLRGVAILLVLLHHFNIAFHLAPTAIGRLLGAWTVRAVARNGNYGVTLFFAVSGFLITSNALRRWGALARVRPGAFYVLRVARIAPCLLLLLLLVAALGAAGLSMFQTRPADPGRAPQPLLVYAAALSFTMNLLLARLGWVNYALGVLWSLSVEEVFYLSFPLCCLLLRRPWRVALFWGLVALVGPIWRATHAGDEAGFLYSYPASFDAIAIGCLAALLGRAVPRARCIPTPLRWLVASGMAALYLCAPIGVSNVWGVSAMALGAAVLLLGAADRPDRPAPRGAGPRAIGWMGRLSYELYLFHLVVLGLIRTAWPPEATAAGTVPLLLALFLVCSCLLAWAIGRGVASPSNRLIRRRLLGAAPAAAATSGRA